MNFVAYYRVSTKKQGLSGLGLEAQRDAVRRYLGSSEIVAEFTEIETGKIANRPQLDMALAAARLHRIPVVVAKVDRLTRNVAFLMRLLEAGVEVRFADLPAIEGPTGRFLLQQMAAVAELEAGMISARTKAALKAAKARGVKLGGNRGVKISREAQMEGVRVRVEKARTRARDIYPTIVKIIREKGGDVTMKEIGRDLDRLGVPTPRGVGGWSGWQVGIVLQQCAVSP